MGNSFNIFLDAVILLLATKKNPNTEVIAKQIINQYNEDIKSKNDIIDPIGALFIKLIEELLLVKGDDETANVEKSALVVKFINEPIIKLDKLLHRSLTKIFNNDRLTENFNSENLEKRLTYGHVYNKINKVVRKMFSKLHQCSNTADIDNQEQLIHEISRMSMSIPDIIKDSKITNKSKSIIESIDFSDKDSIRQALSKYKTKKSQVLKTGLQGLNRMLGSNGGFSLGETCMIYALTHHFKSGLMMTIARGLVKYNKPNFDPKLGKPLILFITLENEANKNLMNMYKTAYEQTYQKSSVGVSDEEIIEFVHDFFSDNGYIFKMERWDGDSTGIDELTQRIEDIRADGYHLVAVLMDYMQLMKKKHSNEQAFAQLSSLTYTLCAKFKNEDVLFITPHQLEGEASRLAASGITNVVKKFGSHNVSGSKEISRHVDFEVFVHIETNNEGRQFLTMQRGKHRSTEGDTPMSHRYCAYPFTEFGCIVDDINRKPGFFNDIYNIEPGTFSDDPTQPVFDVTGKGSIKKEEKKEDIFD